MAVHFYGEGLRVEVRKGRSEKFVRRAYVLPSETRALSHATSTTFQGYREYFCQTRHQEEALKIPKCFCNQPFKNRRRRYGSNSSELAHTQYAFSKMRMRFLVSLAF
jgi:hypothetical protein